LDKNAIKRYATWARVELIARVSQKAEQLGVTKKHSGNPMDQSVHGHLLSATEQDQRAALIARVNATSWQQTMEEVAYTWFNRFCALCYMEVNGYMPSHIRVFTDEGGAFKPQILTEAIHIELKGLDRDKVYQFKDKNQTEALYKYLLITQCNALSEVLPRIFQRIEDYTELLLPDNLLREGSIIEQMITLIPEEDWTDQVQIIGWLYQYYNAEPKDKVFANLKKNIKISKHDIPAATQLFTPDWIVRYMVENSLGRIWLERERTLDDLVDEKAAAEGFGWRYYLPEAEQEPQVQVELKKQRQGRKDLQPADIKCIDPCMGSGHILVYMFDVLMQIYQDYGYSDREAVRSILEHNLYGLDIDDRAAQLAYFAVMMKARQYDRRLLTRTLFDGKPDIPQPQVYPIMESNCLNPEMVAYFVGNDTELRSEMETLMRELKDAKEYGSILNISTVDFDALYARFDEVVDEVHFQQDAVLHALLPFVRQSQVLSQQYKVVVTNPPYMGSNGMNSSLVDFLRRKYSDSWYDLSTVFMERCLEFCSIDGSVSMINIPVWMSKSSFAQLRFKLLSNHTITNMVHFGRGVFGSDFGTTSFVIYKRHILRLRALFRQLYDEIGGVDSNEQKEKWFFEGKGRFEAIPERFLKITSYQFAYWVSDRLLDILDNSPPLSQIAAPRKGLTTGDNDTFVRLWHELNVKRIGLFGVRNVKWYPMTKGGDFRRWYGNNDHVVNWEDDGDAIINFKEDTGKLRSRPQNKAFYFRKCISWNDTTATGRIAFRYQTDEFIPNASGPCVYIEENFWYLFAMLNSIVSQTLLEALAPNFKFEVGQMALVPIIISQNEQIDLLSIESVSLAKKDWDSFETSWDFKRHPML